MTEQAIDSEDQLEGDESGRGEGAGAQAPGKRMNIKKIAIFLVLPLLLVVGAVGTVFFTSIGDSILGHQEQDKEATEKAKLAERRAKAVFFDLPELLVNLNSPGRRTNFLKISISLELSNDADIAKLEGLMPRIVDSFQVYLRELRVSDLKGSAGIYRLREDLLRRVNEAAQPVKINDVLFKEVLVQ